MILYVNGDSHTAGAEAVNSYAFAQDDPLYYGLGRQPHPDNLQASYSCDIANRLFAVLHCDAELASSNDRILRTTREYLIDHQPDLIIIGWATWEREEWLHNNQWFQLTAGGRDSVPEELREKYQAWVVDQTHVTREKKMLFWHDQIWQFHLELQQAKIPHLFFNTYSDFSNIRTGQITNQATETIPNEHDWDNCYIEPYQSEFTYFNWLKSQGFATVNSNSYHYGAAAHRAWAEFVYQNYIEKALTANG